MRPLQSVKHGLHLVPRQHDRQALGRLGRLHSRQPGQFEAQGLLVKKQQRTLGLILRRRRHPPCNRQVRQKGRHLLSAQLARMPLARKDNKSSNPIYIRLFRTETVMSKAQAPAHIVQQARLARPDDPFPVHLGPTIRRYPVDLM